jgi:hypothetical protein
MKVTFQNRVEYTYFDIYVFIIGRMIYVLAELVNCIN